VSCRWGHCSLLLPYVPTQKTHQYWDVGTFEWFGNKRTAPPQWHETVRIVYTVASLEPTADGKLIIMFTSENDRDRRLTLPANRRFLKANVA
jgi:hypothetical protein